MGIPRLAMLALLVSISCGERKKENIATTVSAPKVNADSAYAYVNKQVSFGPRVPQTPAHEQAAAYFKRQLERHGATVRLQSLQATTHDGVKLNLTNIIASFFPEKQKRILLAAHWDTRPYADKDKQKPDAAFDGANDGASGVGVLLELARVMKATPPSVGVDIILFDGEDWGEKANASREVPVPDNMEDWWCLGSQYWSKHKHTPTYTAHFGILLDMVGAEGAHFFREGNSREYAPQIVEKIWNAAEQLGYSYLFVKQDAGAVTDDHVFVNKFGRIPMADIVPTDPKTNNFGDFHHTTADNMSIISKETLAAVGNTVLLVVYRE